MALSDYLEAAFATSEMGRVASVPAPLPGDGRRTFSTLGLTFSHELPRTWF
jgi:hypothetical protein